MGQHRLIMQEFVAYSTMAVTISLAVTRPRLRPFRLHIQPAWAAGGGVLVMLLAGIVDVHHIITASAELWRPFITITAIMVMTAAAQQIGLLEKLAQRIFARPEEAVSRLFLMVFLLAAFTSTVLNNDASVLLLTPLVLGHIKARYPHEPRLLLPFAFAVFLAVGVAPLVVSNPMNMIVASYARVNFNQYLSWMAPITLVGWGITYLVARWLFAAELRLAPKPSPPPVEAEPGLTSVQRWVLILLVAVVGTYPVVAMLDGPSIWIVSLVGALTTVGVAWRKGRVPMRTLCVDGVAWGILVFLLCVFVLALGLRNVGLVDLLATLYHGADLMFIGGVAAVGSALLNNHPMALINMLALEATPGSGRREIFAILIGGDLGPRLLPIGSLAGLLWLDACARYGVRVPLWRFVKVGLAVTIPTLAASLLILVMR